MKPAILLAVGLFGAASACDAHAWSYAVVDNRGHETFLKESALDLTYPPEGVRLPVIVKTDGMTTRGTVLTVQQAQKRSNAAMLIISDLPLSKFGSDWASNVGAH